MVAGSIEAREGVTTGISAADRARTVQVAINPASGPGDVVQPGHVVPLRARPGGVLERAGRSEAAIDLVRLAGLMPAAVVCEILDEQGRDAGPQELRAFGARHGAPLVALEDLVAHRWRAEPLVARVAEAAVKPQAVGEDRPLRAVAYRDALRGGEHVALVRGEPAGAEAALAAVHVECLAGHALGLGGCGCGAALAAARRALAEAERGALVYLTRSGHGLGLGGAPADPGTLPGGHGPGAFGDGAAELPGRVLLGAPPPMPVHALAAQILADLGCRSVRVLGEDPGLAAFGMPTA
jgi:3,4-dihydroxy 2-butanone 4-phosphate synthase/GTP cyclohydrolase II